MNTSKLLKFYRNSVNPPYKDKDVLILLATIFILILIPLTALAVITNRGARSAAAGTATMTLTPATQTVNHNANFTVEVRENSGTEAVNAVQSNLIYDQNALDFISIDTSTSAFSLLFEESGGNGMVKIARTSPNPLTGNQLVAKVTFRAKNTPGITGVDFAAGTAIVRVSDQVDVLGTMTGGVYTIVDPLPNINITSPANNQIVSKTITVAATATDDLSVTKVEFLVDNVLKGSDTTASGTTYSVSLDTTTLTNAVHTLTAKAYDANGNKTSSINFTVDNQAPSAPTGLVALVISSTQINLTWDVSTDNISVTGYDIYRNNVKIQTVTITSYSDTGLVGGTAYSYYVVAKDGQGNLSGQSSVVTATTSRRGDLNIDGKVNIFDASMMTASWGTNNATADLNNDGTVNIFDASILTANWTG